VADLGEGSASPPPLFWVKKKKERKKERKIAEGRKAGRASKKEWGPSLAQGLDPPLKSIMYI